MNVKHKIIWFFIFFLGGLCLGWIILAFVGGAFTNHIFDVLWFQRTLMGRIIALALVGQMAYHSYIAVNNK